MQKNTPASSGFSIIELMVVVAIIGILAVVAIPAYYNYINRTRQANGVQQLMDIKTTQEKYYALYDQYAGAISGTFSSLLSFDPADTRYYTYSVSSTGAATFTAQINGKNGTGLQGDCWQLTQAWADPSTCGTPQGFSFSVLGDLFD